MLYGSKFSRISLLYIKVTLERALNLVTFKMYIIYKNSQIRSVLMIQRKEYYHIEKVAPFSQKKKVVKILLCMRCNHLIA